jgi:hypothetical protein
MRATLGCLVAVFFRLFEGGAGLPGESAVAAAPSLERMLESSVACGASVADRSRDPAARAIRGVRAVVPVL